MTKLRIPHKAMIVVGDGRKALFLSNLGDDVYPNLKVSRVLTDEVRARTSELGTDKPGRVLDQASGRHSAVEQTDWHELAEQKFAHEIAEALEKRSRNGEVDCIILVAPPRTLAELRATLSDAIKEKVLFELAKDLTKHPVYEIERLLTAL